MAIIIKAQGSDNTNDVIKKFKKAIATTDIVQKAKDRRYFKKPSQVRAAKKIEMSRLRKRSRALKRTKNISPAALQRINERLAG